MHKGVPQGIIYNTENLENIQMQNTWLMGHSK